MRNNSSHQIPENSTLSRRRFLTGAVAVPAVVAAPAAIEAADIGDNYDELIFFLDERAETVRQPIQGIRVYDKIALKPDRPQREPAVGALELFGNEHLARYYFSGVHKVFSFNPERVSVHDYFEAQIDDAIARAKLHPEFADWPVVKALDYAKVTSALHAQMQARERWEIEGGYRAANAEVMRLLAATYDFEHRIFTLAVMLFLDLRFKIDLLSIEHWLIDEDELRLILGYISDFAKSDEIVRAWGRKVGAA